MLFQNYLQGLQSLRPSRRRAWTKALFSSLAMLPVAWLASTFRDKVPPESMQFAWSVWVVCTCILVGLTVLSESHRRYYIGGDELLITAGVVIKHLFIVPLEGINDFAVVETALDELWGTGTVAFQTPGGGAALSGLANPRAVLDALREHSKNPAPAGNTVADAELSSLSLLGPSRTHSLALALCWAIVPVALLCLLVWALAPKPWVGPLCALSALTVVWLLWIPFSDGLFTVGPQEYTMRVGIFTRVERTVVMLGTNSVGLSHGPLDRLFGTGTVTLQGGAGGIAISGLRHAQAVFDFALAQTRKRRARSHP